MNFRNITTTTLMIVLVVGVVHGAGRAEQGGPGPGQDAVESRVVVDGLGRRVVVPREPQRIVLAGRAVLMTAGTVWAFPEARERVVGVGRISQGQGNFLAAIDPSYDRITILERNVGPEQVAALAPDLVILKSMMRGNLGEPLERLGIPVVYVDLENPEQYQRDLGVLGEVFGEEERARELQDYFRTVADRVTDVTGGIPSAERPSTLLLYYRATGGEVSFDVPPAGWMQTRLVEMAGGRPVWGEANPGSGWGTVSFEQIAVWDPDTIILVEYSGEALEVRARLADQPRWQALRAVQAGQLYAMPTDYYSWDQPDVRWLLGLQWMARVLHPGRFAADEGNIREFFQVLYQLNDATYRRVVLPELRGDFP